MLCINIEREKKMKEKERIKERKRYARFDAFRFLVWPLFLGEVMPFNGEHRRIHTIA